MNLLVKIFKRLKDEEKIIYKTIIAARKVQTLFWGEANGEFGLEEWRRMFRKRIKKIDNIDISKPHHMVEMKKRLLQNAALSVALLNILNKSGKKIKDYNENIPSNLPEYKN